MEKKYNVINQMQVEVGNMREEVGSQIREQMKSFTVMFARQNQVKVSPDFPPRERTDPIFPELGPTPRAADSLDFEVEPTVSGEIF